MADQGRALAEVLRVLRPGGRLLFFEHVAAPAGSLSARLRHWIAPVTHRLDHGCRPDRRTTDRVEAAGFAAVSFGRYRRPGPFGAFGPYVAGEATR